MSQLADVSRRPGIFKSNLSDTQTFDSIYGILKLRQLESNFYSKYKGISIYLYKYINGQVSPEYITFNSINQLSKHSSISSSGRRYGGWNYARR